MAKRSYRQNCALALTSDLVGERWSLLLVRDLLVGPKRYRELARSLRGMGSNLLAERLKDLEAGGIIEKRALDNGGHVYALTAAGKALEPAILALVKWGLTHLADRVEGYHHQDEWDLVALKATFQPALAANKVLGVQFRGDDLLAWVEIRDQQMFTEIGELAAPDIVIDGTVKDLFVTTTDPAALLAAGSSKDLERFMSSFALEIDE